MDYVRLLFGFRGRTNRAKYLVAQLALLAFWLFVWPTFSNDRSPQWQATYFDGVLVIAMIWINIATTVKRLHDHNRGGWWAIAVFILNRLSFTYYGLFLGGYFGVDISAAKELLLVMLVVALSVLQTWVGIELIFVPGTEGRTRFGPDPLTSVAPGAPPDLRQGPHSVPDFLVQGAGPSPESQR